MDVNHEMYRTDLIKIAFILLFMNSSSPSVTWKYQFIDLKMKLPPPANPNDKLRQYANFRKDLVSAFSMFDSVGNVLNELWALRMKTGSSINEHIARFKLLAAATEIDANYPLTIELLKEMLQALRTWMMNLKMPLNKLDDWYTWAIKLDHQYHKSRQAINRTRENAPKKTQPRYYFPWKKRDLNVMDVNRLMFDKQTQLMEEGQCFRCKKTRHRANKCPEGTEDKGQKREEPKKRMNRKQFYTHVWAIFKDLDEEGKDKFLEEAQNAGS